MSMKPRRIRFLILMTLLLLAAAPAVRAHEHRTAPIWGKWSVGCGNSGLCFTSAFVREQSTWLDIRIVRDWPAEAPPLLRLTANAALSDTGTITVAVDGKEVDTLPVAQLRETQASVVPPSGFRPLGGEGFWYPSGPVTDAVLDAIVKGKELTVGLPIGAEMVILRLSLEGIRNALAWLDKRQYRDGTLTAAVLNGDTEAGDAPSALPILSPDMLPPPVTAAWDGNRFCSDIDPAIFTSLDAVAAPMADGSTLYILPCGAPSAYNTPYVVIHSLDNGKTRQIHFARMSDQGPVATDLIYNIRWNAGKQQITSLFKGSGVGDCGTWSRWRWTGTIFALKEEAARQTCDGKETAISSWSTTWGDATVFE